MQINKIYTGDCIDRLIEIEENSVDMVYFDPPFYTQKKHFLKTRDNKKEYEFSDSWSSIEEYLNIIKLCLIQCKRILKDTGNIFVHCDKTASHYIRVKLDEVFGMDNFRSEIIWSYKRWSNSKKGLLNSHQNILYYSKSKNFKFNTFYTEYSSTTNLDQILQDREKDKNGKSVYKTDKNGNIILGKEKKGVPLSDVWEIPYLNPKAKERVGYPTQKPVILLQEIIKISTDIGDLIVDPFCGSGTTCVAAKSMDRNFIGIDKSEEAVLLSNKRLQDMIITESHLVKNGQDSYNDKNENELFILERINALPVQRNSGIDGFLRKHYKNKPVPIKIQASNESLIDAIKKLESSTQDKDFELKIVIQTKNESKGSLLFDFKTDVQIVKENNILIDELLKMEEIHSVIL